MYITRRSAGSGSIPHSFRTRFISPTWMAYAKGSANLYTGPSRRGHHAGQRQGGHDRTAPGIRAPVSIDHDSRYGAFQTRAYGQRQPHIANHEVRGDGADQLTVLPDVASDDIRRKDRSPFGGIFKKRSPGIL